MPKTFSLVTKFTITPTRPHNWKFNNIKTYTLRPITITSTNLKL